MIVQSFLLYAYIKLCINIENMFTYIHSKIKNYIINKMCCIYTIKISIILLFFNISLVILHSSLL